MGLRGVDPITFVGEARLGGVAPVCDATERVFDQQLIECIGIVFVDPFFGFGMARAVGRSPGSRRNPRAARFFGHRCSADRRYLADRRGHQ